MIREAKISDVKEIVALEKEYYDGHSMSEEMLAKWIENGNFFMMDENSKIVGSIYFEFLNEIKDLPWVHEPIKNLGKFAYISEIAVDFGDKVPELFGEVVKVAEKNKCEGIVWLTGEKGKHDKIEREFIKANGFKIFKNVENWECSPGYFVNDHSLWLKKL